MTLGERLPKGTEQGHIRQKLIIKGGKKNTVKNDETLGHRRSQAQVIKRLGCRGALGGRGQSHLKLGRQPQLARCSPLAVKTEARIEDIKCPWEIQGCPLLKSCFPSGQGSPGERGRSIFVFRAFTDK